MAADYAAYSILLVQVAVARYLGVRPSDVRARHRLREDLGLDAFDVALVAIALGDPRPTHARWLRTSDRPSSSERDRDGRIERAARLQDRALAELAAQRSLPPVVEQVVDAERPAHAAALRLATEHEIPQ